MLKERKKARTRKSQKFKKNTKSLRDDEVRQRQLQVREMVMNEAKNTPQKKQEQERERAQETVDRPPDQKNATSFTEKEEKKGFAHSLSLLSNIMINLQKADLTLTQKG